MELHELFSAAVEDLPEMADVLPAVERSIHRRSRLRRSFAVAATTVLVLGVGTVTIAAPWSRQTQPAAPSTVAVTSPSADFPPQVVKLLQSAWPVKGQTISWDPADAPATTKSKSYNEYWQRLSYRVTTATGSYGLQLRVFAVKGLGSVQSLPVTSWVTKDESAGTAYLEDKGTAVVVIMLIGARGTHVSEPQLRRLAADTMPELYQLGIDYGMGDIPNVS